MIMSEPARLLRALITALALVAALGFAACGETQDDESSSGGESTAESSGSGEADPNAPIKEGLKTVSIPKQLGNPYEEFEHSGVDEALEELDYSNNAASIRIRLSWVGGTPFVETLDTCPASDRC